VGLLEGVFVGDAVGVLVGLPFVVGEVEGRVGGGTMAGVSGSVRRVS